MGGDTLNEKSEEVKELLLEVVGSLVERQSPPPPALLASYSPLVRVLHNTLSDDAPLIKRRSSTLLLSLARLSPRHFYPKANTLIPPLVASITHQHWRIRVDVVKAIGEPFRGI